MRRMFPFMSVLFCSCLLTPSLTLADINVKGFGSIVGGMVVDGDGYVAEYPNVGIYDDKFDVGNETRLGIQASTELNEKARATIQIMSRANNDYEPEVEWMYLTYALKDNFDLQAGRMRLPVYIYSEYMDVGIAYPWVRIPADTYSLDFVNFNGVKLNYLTGSEEIPVRLSLITGREENPDTELMTYLFPPRVSRTFEDIIGVVVDGSFANINLRLSYTEARMFDRRTTNFNAGSCRNARGVDETTANFDDFNFENSGPTIYLSKCKIAFADAALTVNFGDFSIISEYNDYYPFYESYFTSLNYRTGDNTFYLLWSKFDLNGPFEVHDTTSLGMRRDISYNMALKFDVSVFNDDGFSPFRPDESGNLGAPNPVYKFDGDGDGVREARTYDGDAVIMTVAFDFIF